MSEKIIFRYTIVMTVFFSVTFHDLFPFSINPLYTKKTPQVSIIQVSDHQNKILSNEFLGTYLDYASLFERAGLKSEPTINPMGKIIQENELREKLLEKGKLLEAIPFFQTKIFQVTLNSQKIPQIKEIQEKVTNPFYKPSSSLKEEIEREVYRRDKYYYRIKNERLR